MKLGAYTACLHDKPVAEALRILRDLGLDSAEITPNWIVSSWPPETGEILAWQWREQLIPYWRELATDNGVARLCVELHCNQLVCNIPSLSCLRL